mmetsp:Transcript_103089/g.291484  ORF Transcript_103089/g.291484 Transcript_103089/m.291484 type:complete len:218 (+) Transcript_103089:733-1386(+)
MVPRGRWRGHNSCHQGRRVVRVVCGHLPASRTPWHGIGVVQAVKLHACDGSVDKLPGHLLQQGGPWHPQLPLAGARLGPCRSEARPCKSGTARLLNRALDVVIAEIVEQSIAPQDQDVSMLHGRGADHGALDHGVGVCIAEAVQALHLHGSPGVITPRLRLEHGAQPQGQEAAWSQHEQGTVSQACRHQIRVSQHRDQQRCGAVCLCRVEGLLDAAG